MMTRYRQHSLAPSVSEPPQTLWHSSSWLTSYRHWSRSRTIPTMPRCQRPAATHAVFKALSALERDHHAWMKYVNRLDKEAQGLFANGVRSSKYNKTKQSMIMQNKPFTQWLWTTTTCSQTRASNGKRVFTARYCKSRSADIIRAHIERGASVPASGRKHMSSLK